MSHPTVPAVTDDTFEMEVVDADLPVLVDFWAAWCPPCHQLSPVVAELAAEYAGRLKVVAVDVDANPGVARRYQVMSMPTLALLAGGVELTRIVGAYPKRRILAGITPHLDRGPATAATATG